MVSTKCSISCARPLQETHWSAWVSLPGVPYLTILPLFCGGVAWWHLRLKALPNLFSDFITEANNNHLCCTCGPVGRQDGHVWNFLFFTFGELHTLGVCLHDCQRGEHEHSLKRKEWSSSLCRSCWEALGGVLKWLWAYSEVAVWILLTRIIHRVQSLFLGSLRLPFPGHALLWVLLALPRSHPGYLHIWLPVALLHSVT